MNICWLCLARVAAEKSDALPVAERRMWAWDVFLGFLFIVSRQVVSVWERLLLRLFLRIPPEPLLRLRGSACGHGAGAGSW